MTVNPAAVPQVHLDTLSRLALRGIREAFKDPEYRACIETRIVQRKEDPAHA